LAVSLTLVSEFPLSYYSGMLPGAVSKLYKNEDIMVWLEPVTNWCNGQWIQKKVSKILASENKIITEDGTVIDYDVLAINVGSKTKDTLSAKGVWEHGLTTRPINDLLPKIEKKENELKAKNIVPKVVICGAGASGTELSMAFKARWSKFFGKDIEVILVGPYDTPLQGTFKTT